MKRCLLFLLFIPMSFVMAQSQVSSDVYAWPESGGDILAGGTTALQHLNVHAYDLSPGQILGRLPATSYQEQLIIVKSGALNLTLRGEALTLGRGSVVVVAPGDAVRMENAGGENAAFYVFRYRAKAENKGEADSPSFAIDWDTVAMTTNNNGGRRNFFDKPTTVFERFEMHVTTLNIGLQSHPPHTHEAEEFILIMEGEVAEHIDGEEKPASAGDLIFLDSMVPHTIRNVGQVPATYFAFQWE